MYSIIIQIFDNQIILIHLMIALVFFNNKCKSEGFGSCDDFPEKQISSKNGPISWKSKSVLQIMPMNEIIRLEVH